MNTNTLFATRLPGPRIAAVRAESARQRRPINLIVDAALASFLALAPEQREGLTLANPIMDDVDAARAPRALPQLRRRAGKGGAR